MKVAGTIVALLALACCTEFAFSGISLHETLRSDFLRIDAPNDSKQTGDANSSIIAPDREHKLENITEEWIETIRRRRTRRQSRFV